MLDAYLKSSIGRKQIVAVTGLLLIGYLIAHLAGNLLIYLGPEAFNHYAEKLAGLRPGLYAVEFGLLGVFLIHMLFTATLVLDNIRSRPVDYKMKTAQGERSWATRLMPYTGTAILLFVIWHLLDFTFTDKFGPRSILSDGQSYGLYGVVYNAFTDPFHSTLYIIAMLAIGLHLSHGVESFLQTFGLNNAQHAITVKEISYWFAIIITTGYSSIPIYVMIHYYSH
ncbi:MAG TPA: succinate dehydrogenase cytochrome b subunit [Candidatus Omnitrophota bacterium]|nr:succinate dehydrogenase cytochrome b subunit [Candidatus Omnitrophota bacterium]